MTFFFFVVLMHAPGWAHHPRNRFALTFVLREILLLFDKKTHAAATWLGLTVLFVELVAHVPIGVMERASLDNGLNYLTDTLMFCGAVLLLAAPCRAKRSGANHRLVSVPTKTIND